MRNEKLWKRLAVLAMSAVLLVPAPMASAAGEESVRQEAQMREADADGFETANGVLTKYNGKAENVEIPGTVTSIGEEAFSGCTTIKSVVIPKNVTSIGKSAFYECSNLSSVTLSEGLINIGDTAFLGCKSLQAITIPGSLKTMGASAFNGCENLKTVEITKGAASIGDMAFIGTGVTSITIPGSIKKVTDRAFMSCFSLKSVTFEPGVTEIGSSVFNGCKSLEIIEIPETVKKIGGKAFGACTSLKSVTIPKGTTTIGNVAFQLCSNLTSVYVPETVTTFGTDVFKGCDKLTLYGKKGSSVEDYAEKNEIPFGSSKSIADCQITISPESYLYDGKAKTPEVTVKDGSDTLTERVDYTVVYSNNTNVGNAKAVITGRGKYNGTAEKTFIIHEVGKKAISDCTITISPASYTYDGKAKTPAVIVKDGSKTLTKGTDYTVAYSNNIKVGTAKAAVTGIGTYTGTTEKTFQIKDARNSQSLDYKKSYSKTYGDKAFKLNVKVKKGDGKLTYKSSDKKVVKVDGKGKVTIKGTGTAAITVKAEKTAKYNAKSVKITIKVKPAKGKVKSLKTQTGKKLKISWKQDKNATGYEIQYSTDKKFKDKKTTKITTIKKNKTTSKTVSKLKKGKKYYVRVRAYKNIKVEGKTQKLYGSWSSKMKSGSIKN